MRTPNKLYVVTAPTSIWGLYETWDLCQQAVAGVAGARFQAVRSRAEAEALLSGDALALDPGLYAFVDGNPIWVASASSLSRRCLRNPPGRGDQHLSGGGLH